MDTQKHKLVLVKFSAFFIAALMAATALLAPLSPTSVAAQQPTGSIPTVTGTPLGPFITVTYPEQINIRSGPNSTIYPAIGVMLPGETAPAIGKSVGGDWIQISYPGVPNNVGWVYAPLVSISPYANLIPVDAPPTPTPLTTATIDPTLQSEFLPQVTATRLPTYTPAPPIEPIDYGPSKASGVFLPIGLVITVFLAIGVFAGLVSYFRDR